MIESDSLIPDKFLSNKHVAQDLFMIVDDANLSEIASVEECVKNLVEKRFSLWNIL